MKMIAYAVGAAEKPIFQRFYQQYGVELTMTPERPSLENAHLSQGMDCVNVLSETVITPELWDIYHKNSVKIGITRCIGMEHMNRDYAEKLGIAVMNITYSPASVADYAIMMMLMVLRNIKPILLRSVGQDFTVAGLRGRELPNMTVGIVGAGRIGTTVASHLAGFGCKVLYWNRTPKDTIAAEYRPLPELLQQCDIISLHLSSNDETYHFMDAEKLQQMKPGSILINTSRGALVDSSALIDVLESGHLSGAGLDVLDGDRNIYYSDHKNQMLRHHEMAILGSMPNVLLLPHMAYYTDQALEDMVRNSLAFSSQYFSELSR